MPIAAGISENGLSRQQVNRVQVSRVDHTQGPWDGSLYATVNKSRNTEVETANRVHNGPMRIPNGSLASSVDSGACALENLGCEIVMSFIILDLFFFLFFVSQGTESEGLLTFSFSPFLFLFLFILKKEFYFHLLLLIAS